MTSFQMLLGAAAVSDAPGDVITWASMLTVAGASGAAVAAVAFIRIFQDLSPRRARQLAAVLGVVVVEIAVVAVGRRGWAELGLGLVVGIQAGLAASKAAEIGRYGWNHQVVSSS
jgi:hypothetical protein